MFLAIHAFLRTIDDHCSLSPDHCKTIETNGSTVKTIDINDSRVQNHRYQWFNFKKTLEQPLIHQWNTIDNDGSRNHWQTIDFNGTLTQTIDIPSCPKFYHRGGLLPDVVTERHWTEGRGGETDWVWKKPNVGLVTERHWTEGRGGGTIGTKIDFLKVFKWILLWFQYIRPGKKEFVNLVTVLNLHIDHKYFENHYLRVKNQNCRRPMVWPIKTWARRALSQWEKN